jgi:serine kinase of HPr protein (carbohydrate metabolism regulator)
MGDDTVHASVARVGAQGVLIRGASGSGKSSLLMALLTSRDAGAVLVADDRALLAVEDGRLTASVPPALAGLMEIRGTGIVRREHIPATAIDLVVDLKPLAECPRYPTDEEAFAVLAGVRLPRIFIAIGTHDGVARVIAALASADRRLLT